MKTKALNNMVLVEVIREDDGVSRTDRNESLDRGRVVDFAITGYHLTASAGIRLEEADGQRMAASLKDMIGKVVRWEDFAEQGQTFEENGKIYALVPWWRLTAYEEDEDE